MARIPFNRPTLAGKEFRYIEEALHNMHLSGDGPFTERCQSWLERELGCHKAMFTPSCTAALEMAAILAEVGAGDEVIMPSYTFVSTANAFVLRGAVPVFVDIRPDTLNIDERQIPGAVTPRTKAIVVVHYAGVGCRMEPIVRLARQRNLLLVEDAAQGLLSSYKGRPLGTFGAFGALSFHETKNVMCGEGGALLIGDSSWVERAEIIRQKGTNRNAFLRGQADKYSWVDIGSSHVPSEINAAFLWSQLEEAHAITARRLEIWQHYHEALEPLEEAGRLRRPSVPADCRHNAHMYYILLPGPSDRGAVLEELNARDVNAVFHFVPLHSARAGRAFGRIHGELCHTDFASQSIVRLPLWVGMGEEDVSRVVEALTEVV